MTTNNIDLGLAVIESTAKKHGIRNVTLTTPEIAEICGCQPRRIYDIARNAKRKLIRSQLKAWVL